MAKQVHLLVLAITLSVIYLASISAVADDGTATFYTAPYVPSACDGYQDEGVMIAAASDALWDGGSICGTYLSVRCTGGTNKGPHPCVGNNPVVVKVVDYCPPGCQGTIDLSQEAFESIANPDAGKVKIEFNRV